MRLPLVVARKVLKLGDRLFGGLAARTGVRFLVVYLQRIGEIAQALDLYVKLGELGWRPRYRAVVVAPPGQVANRAYLDYWRQHVRVVSNPVAASVLAHAVFSQRLRHEPPGPRPDGSPWDREDATIAAAAEWERQGRPPLLRLTAEHAERGVAALTDWGAPAGAWFVALHVRSPGYLQESASSHRWFRNASIDSYLPAIDAVVARGGWVVRLGDPSMPPLPPLEHVVDYPHQEARQDWLDVYLAAACRFLIGTTSGMVSVAESFGTPLVATNWLPFSTVPRSARSVYAPKLYRSLADGRVLSFAEMLSPGLSHCYDGRRFADLGFEAVDNTADEILELTVEMLDRMDGNVRCDAEDERRQERFRSVFTHLGGDVRARVGREFLRHHAELLPSA